MTTSTDPPAKWVQAWSDPAIDRDGDEYLKHYVVVIDEYDTYHSKLYTCSTAEIADKLGNKMANDRQLPFESDLIYW